MIGIAIVAAVVLTRCGGGDSSAVPSDPVSASTVPADPVPSDPVPASTVLSDPVAAARREPSVAEGVWSWDLGACSTMRAVFTTTVIVDCDAGAAASTLTVRLADGRAVRTGDGSVVTLADGRVIGYRTLRATASTPERRAYYEYGRDGRITRQLGTLPTSLLRGDGETEVSTVWVPTVHDGLLVGLRVGPDGEARRASAAYRENAAGQQAAAAPDGLRVFDLRRGEVVASYSAADPAIGGSAKSVWAVVDGLVHLKGYRQPSRGFDIAAGRVTWSNDLPVNGTDATTTLALLGRLNLGQAGVLDLRRGVLDPAAAVIDGHAVPVSGPRQHRPSDGRLTGELVLAGLHVVVDGGVATAYRGGVEVWSTKGTVTDVALAPGGLLVIAGSEAHRSVWFVASA